MNRLTIFGVAAALVLVVGGSQGLKELRAKAEQQERATEVVQRWKQSYRALAASNQEWSQKYPSAAAYRDVLGIYQSLRLSAYGLNANPDQLTNTRTESVTYNNAQLGLMRVCLGSTAANSDAPLIVEAAKVSQLLAGVNQLAQRPDIEIGGVTVKTDAGKATAQLAGFCVLMRQEQAA